MSGERKEREEGDAAERTPERAPAQRLSLGGMARMTGIDFFGPNYRSEAQREDSNIFVRVERSNLWRPKSAGVRRVLRWPVFRSLLFWGNFLVQILGSVRTLVTFGLLLAGLFVGVQALQFGSQSSGEGVSGGVFSLLATFPILPLLLLLFVVMKFTALGRYHGAEHKAVAAYERTGEVTQEEARRSPRLHPRCGTNILVYILAASLLEPFISWWPYAILQFILISEAWFVFGQTRPSIIIGNFFQLFFTTSEPRPAELEVAVESLNLLLNAENGGYEVGKSPVQLVARY